MLCCNLVDFRDRLDLRDHLETKETLEILETKAIRGLQALPQAHRVDLVDHGLVDRVVQFLWTQMSKDLVNRPMTPLQLLQK